MTWTTEKIETALKLVDEGLSATMIGARIGKTRNAVLGKMHRMGVSLPGDNHNGRKKAKRINPHAPKPAAKTHPAPARIAEPKSAPPPAAIAPKPAPPAATAARPDPIHFTDMPQLGRCRWPLWGADDRFEDKHFCGAGGDPVHVYCEAHRRQAYEPAARRRKRNGFVLKGI